MATYQAATTALSRVFVSEGLPGPGNPPVYQNCFAMGATSQGIGGVEYIYCPDPDNYNQFVTVGEIQEREEQVETSLTGHFPLQSRSSMTKWAKNKTPLAIHVHFGTATNPQNFNHFLKAVIFDEGAKITNLDIDDLGALEESGAVGESCDISAASFYEVVPLTFVEIQPGLIDTGGVDAWLEPLYDEYLPVDNRWAGFVVTNGDGSTNAGKLIWTVDGGQTYGTTVLTDALGAGNEPTGVAAINGVPVIISSAAANMYYIDVVGGDVLSSEVVEVTVGQALNAIDSSGAVGYVVGDSAYMGKITDYTAAPDAVTTGSVANLVSVACHLSGSVVAGDSDGYVFFSPDGANFGATQIAAGESITAVEVVNADVAWAGTDTGKLFYTQNAGQDWIQSSFPGSGTGSVTDINFPTLSVGFIAHEPASGNAKLIKTVGAGASGTWFTTPYTGTLPVAKWYKVALMRNEPNLLLGAGPATAVMTADGTILLGSE